MHVSLPPEKKVSLSTHSRPQDDTLPFNVERYRGYLEGMNLSEAQAADMLQALWSILSAFVDLSFGVDSVHLARPQPKDDPLETGDAAEKPIPGQQPGDHVAKDVGS